jgi:hypothetical protein
VKVSVSRQATPPRALRPTTVGPARRVKGLRDVARRWLTFLTHVAAPRPVLTIEARPIRMITSSGDPRGLLE